MHEAGGAGLAQAMEPCNVQIPLAGHDQTLSLVGSGRVF